MKNNESSTSNSPSLEELRKTMRDMTHVPDPVFGGHVKRLADSLSSTSPIIRIRAGRDAIIALKQSFQEPEGASVGLLSGIPVFEEPVPSVLHIDKSDGQTLTFVFTGESWLQINFDHPSLDPYPDH